MSSHGSLWWGTRVVRNVFPFTLASLTARWDRYGPWTVFRVEKEQVGLMFSLVVSTHRPSPTLVHSLLSWMSLLPNFELFPGI